MPPSSPPPPPPPSPRERMGLRVAAPPRARLADLPLDVLRVLLTHMSARPRSAAWRAAAGARDVLAVLRAGGPLSDLVRESFPAVSMCARRGSGRALFAPDAAVMLQLAGELGAWLSDLTVVISPLTTSLSPLARHCTRLRSLHLVDRFGDFDLPALLAATGASLRDVDLQGYILPGTHVKALARCCARLESLALQFKMCGEVLRDVWAAAGGTLQVLALHGPFLTRGMYPLADGGAHGDPLEEIALLCTRVRVLRLEGFEGDAVRLAALMGNRLQTIRFLEAGSCPPPDDLARILDLCPTVAVDAFVEAAVVDTLLVLADRARVLHLRGVLVDGLDVAGAAVRHLEQLHVHAGQGYECDLDAFLAAFLDAPKRRLTEVRFPHGVCTPNAVAAMARTLHHVERFSCAVPRVTKELFAEFSASNVQLRSVCVQCVHAFDGGDDDAAKKARAEQAAVAFVSDFARCSELRELELKDEHLAGWSREIEAACRPLRGRGVDVFIGGVQYFP